MGEIKNLRYLITARNILILKKGGTNLKHIYIENPQWFYLFLSIPILGNFASFAVFLMSLFDIRQVNKDKKNELFYIE